MPVLSPAIDDLVGAAARSPDRARRDAAFAQLMDMPEGSADAVRALVQDIRGITECRDRVRAVGVALAHRSEGLELLEWIAIHHSSSFVRIEACDGLARRGIEASPALCRVLDAAVARGERPRDSVVGDLISLALQALCRAGGPGLRALLERVSRGLPVGVVTRLVTLLVAHGRMAELQALDVRAAAAERAAEDDGAAGPHWTPLRVRIAEALLAHDHTPPELLVSIACTAPVLRLRIRALDALEAPGLAEAEALTALVRGPDAPLSRAACRAWSRAIPDRVEALRAVAAEQLPAPSAAWWTLAETDPAWCGVQLDAEGLPGAMALLPGRETGVAAPALLAAVARSEGALRLRLEATHRLLALESTGDRHRVALWLQARVQLATDGATVSTADRTVARLVADTLEDTLATTDSLHVALEALVPRLRPVDHRMVADALCAVEATEDDTAGAMFAGLLFHADEPERLRALVGLCRQPIASLTRTLIQRATAESHPVLRQWALAAAWMAWRAQPAPALAAWWMERLERADPELSAVLHPRAAPPVDARDAQLAAWLALEPEARVEALITRSRAHRGRKLTRIQARDLSRALARPGRARPIVGLLMKSDRPGSLARALHLARRSGAGRSRRLEAASAELDGASLEAEPTVVAAALSDPAQEGIDLLALDADDPDWPPPEGTALPAPSMERARVVAPVRADIEAILEVLHAHVDAPVDRTRSTLRDALVPEGLGALRALMDDSLVARWRRLMPGMALFDWPADRAMVLTDPVVLAVLELGGDARRRGMDPGEGLEAMATRCAAAWAVVLAEAPPVGPDLDHLAQALFAFGQVFPERTSRLVEAGAAHHPQWRPLLLAAWLSDPGRLDRSIRAAPAARPAVLVAAVARSALARTLGDQIAPLPAVDAATRRWRCTESWLPRAEAVPTLPSAVPDPSAPELSRVAPVLAAGAWSPHGMDYPSISLTVRRDFSLRLVERAAQRQIAAALAVPTLFRRILEHGRPSDLLHLIWSRDCVLSTGTASPFDDAPIADEALLGALWPVFLGMPARSDAVEPPQRLAELAQLPIEDPRQVVRWMPADQRRLPGRTLIGLHDPGPWTDIHGRERSVGGPPSWWDTEDHAAVVQQVLEDARAYVVLRAERPGRTRIARKTLRRFWRRAAAVHTPSLQELRARHGPDRIVEGLVQGLLTHLVDGPPAASCAPARDKQVAIRTLRQLCLAWHFTEPEFLTRPPRETAGPDLEWITPDETHAALRTLHGLVHQTPREVAVVLGLSDAQGLPTLLGGARSLMERGVRELLSELAPQLSRPSDAAVAPVVYTLRPLPKSEAVMRGELGGDCSSSMVPFRCMSPHHTYYGVFLEGEQQRGYLTLFEAWARQPDGTVVPSLVLETINIPIPIFDAVQLDLVHLVEAIAHHRGLAPRIAMVTAWWAWNYPNGDALRHARMTGAGTDTILGPADPWCWSVYDALMPAEATTYSPFQAASSIRLLGPIDPAVDRMQAENIAEARRIRALPRKVLVATAWEDDALRGFISSIPVPGAP